MSSFLEFNSDFVLYGRQHWIMIFLTFGLAIGLPILAKKHYNFIIQLWISRGIAILISAWVILYIPMLLYLNKFNYKTDLPFDICNLIGLVLPFLMWQPNERVFPYLYLYIMAGTTQAVFGPHLFDGFPNFVFLKYWIVHSGLIIYILFVAVLWNYQVRWQDLRRSFLLLQVYILFVFLINKLIGANYIYLVERPPTAPVLDYLGDWPMYIFAGELIFMFLLFMVYLPYLKLDKK